MDEGGPSETSSPRNLIICCDGTSNEPGLASTNVVRFFRCLEKDEHQLVFYDPGVGTTGLLDLWRRRTNRLKALAEQATGYGLDAHVTEAYRFVCANYRDGDQISILGFSRGAYTARVLAGLIHLVGLLRPAQSNIADYALKAYKRSSDEDDLAIGWNFARTVGTRRAPIHFLGLWDTVGSMIAPLKDRIGFGLTHLPYTRRNPSVARVRHAMAIDERRRLFRPSRWVTGDFVPNRFHVGGTGPQDFLEVWFAGTHADVGGGYPERESGLAKLSLLWMVGEANAAGLRFDRDALSRIGDGAVNHRGELVYAGRNALGRIHPQPTGGWWGLEYVPKKLARREWADRGAFLGFYLPRAEPRRIAAGDAIHESVPDRMGRSDYAPINLAGDLTTYRIVGTREL